MADTEAAPSPAGSDAEAPAASARNGAPAREDVAAAVRAYISARDAEDGVLMVRDVRDVVQAQLGCELTKSLVREIIMEESATRVQIKNEQASNSASSSSSSSSAPSSASASEKPDRARVEAAVLAFIQGKDMGTLDVPKVREHVQREVGGPVSKGLVREIILDSTRPGDEEEATSDDDSDDDSDSAGEAQPAKKKKVGKGGFSQKLYLLSPELAAVVGVERETRPQVVKRLWEYIRANSLQNPANKTEILCDAKFEKVFRRKKVTMFSMNKYLSPHLRTEAQEAAAGGFDLSALDKDDDGNSAASGPKRKAAAKSPRGARKRAKAEAGADSKAKTGNAFLKPLRISEALQAFMGSEMAGRAAVTKQLWAHIKAHELQDPKDKRTVLCDATLRELLGRDKVTIFSMSKFIQPHFIKDG